MKNEYLETNSTQTKKKSAKKHTNKHKKSINTNKPIEPLLEMKSIRELQRKRRESNPSKFKTTNHPDHRYHYRH